MASLQSDWKLLVAIALMGVLLLSFGCAQGPPAGAKAAPSNITVDDLGAIENPDAESMDTGMPLEDI